MNLTEIIEGVSCALTGDVTRVKVEVEIEFERRASTSGEPPATRSDVESLRISIMSKITEFAEAVQGFQTAIATGLAGLGEDIAGLKAKIEELGTSQGLTAEETALLDEIQTQAGALAAGITALDALTPPPAPVEDLAPAPDPVPDPAPEG